MNVLITGASGFVGQWLARQLLQAGHTVWGATRAIPERHRILDPAEAREINWQLYNLEDEADIERLILQVRPQAIYHLAANSSPHESFQNPAGTFRVNVLGAIHLLQAIRRYADAGNAPPRLLLVGSGQMYGRVPPEALPLRETAPIDPVNPYSVSKAAQELVGRQYWHSFKLPIIMTRSFNHIGPGQYEHYAVSHFACSLAAIGLGQAKPVLSVGNLSAQRDFTDVRDTVEAYRLLMEQGNPGEVYNVCSGRLVSMESVLQQLIASSGLEVEIQVDSQRLRPADEPLLQGANDKLVQATGWQPSIPLAQTLADILEFHRRHLRLDSASQVPAT